MPGQGLRVSEVPVPAPRGRKSATTERIIEVAERLFGTVGIEAASMRQVMLEAGASNKSAVAYHFGDRDNLILAIWRRRLPELEQSRARMLAEARASGNERDPRTIMRALFLPSYEQVDEQGFHRYAAFLNQALRWSRGRELRDELMVLSPSSAEAIRLMRDLCPDLDDQTFRWRLSAASTLFLDLVAARDCAPAEERAQMDEERFLAEAIQVCTACCTADPVASRM